MFCMERNSENLYREIQTVLSKKCEGKNYEKKEKEREADCLTL